MAAHAVFLACPVAWQPERDNSWSISRCTARNICSHRWLTAHSRKKCGCGRVVLSLGLLGNKRVGQTGGDSNRKEERRIGGWFVMMQCRLRGSSWRARRSQLRNGDEQVEETVGAYIGLHSVEDTTHWPTSNWSSAVSKNYSNGSDIHRFV